MVIYFYKLFGLKVIIEINTFTVNLSTEFVKSLLKLIHDYRRNTNNLQTYRTTVVDISTGNKDDGTF